MCCWYVISFDLIFLLVCPIELIVMTYSCLHDLGCVGLLLETISPFLDNSSPILNHVLRIVELLGAYRSVQL